MYLIYNERKRKTSICEADICFSALVNEQTACEAGDRARKRGFASFADGERGSATEERNLYIMKKSYLKYFTGLLLFGSNGVVASAIALQSYEIVLLRSVIGGALLLALFLFSGGRFAAFQKHKKAAFLIILSGAAMAADWLFLFEAYDRIGVSLGLLINYCGPAIVIALSPLILKERLTTSKVAALLAALTGACLISGGAAFGLHIWGLVCAALSAVSYAVLVLANKLAKGVDGMENATLQLLSTAVVVVLFVACRQGLRIDIAVGDWLPILWLGLVNTGLGCFFYFSSIGQMPAQSVAVCGYLEPLTAVLLSALFLGERMNGWQIFGGALIIGGALYGELGKKPAA